jgi:hypothetical protein
VAGHGSHTRRLLPSPLLKVLDISPNYNRRRPSIDWWKLYYVQYITSLEYLYNVLMIWSKFEEIGPSARRIMLYPSHRVLVELDDIDPAQRLTRLLNADVGECYVKLEP